MAARKIRYAAPIYLRISAIQALANITAPRPSAADVDQMSEPVVTPDATASLLHRPDDIDVPAIASVAGPGLALATSAARRMVRRLVSIIGIASSFFLHCTDAGIRSGVPTMGPNCLESYLVRTDD